ncbi:hypothetical protein BBP40_002558 [Aspergillus hancockii]|nr:hypothetical protein BBP40_002558 [Aspergillus hancockii]
MAPSRIDSSETTYQRRASKYQRDALTWLESLGLGFDRNDKSTWKKENLPQSWKGGMCLLHFSAAHEKYMWDVRWYVRRLDLTQNRRPLTFTYGISLASLELLRPSSDSGKLNELVVSFERISHCRNLLLASTILNPGLTVTKYRRAKDFVVFRGTSATLFDQYFEENPVSSPMPWRTAKHKDFHPFSEKDLDWYRERGCELIKVGAEPGDLFLWDSRQTHWAQFGESDVVHTIVYATYTPAAWMSYEDRGDEEGVV